MEKRFNRGADFAEVPGSAIREEVLKELGR